MFILYLALFLAGLLLMAIASRKKSRHVWTAAVGTLLTVLAFIGGFSIGPFVVKIAGLVLALAALGIMLAGRARHPRSEDV